MKRLIALVVLSLVLMTSSAWAQGSPGSYMGSLGFHSTLAPLGVRWWVSDKWGLDAGLGVGSTETPANITLSHWALDVGVPICLKRFDKLGFLLRPGLLYQSQEVVIAAGPPVNTDNNTSMSIGAELEAEYFFADNFSVSAAQGFEVVNVNPAVGSSTSSWGSTGSDFTSVGFHVYLFGKK